MLWPREQRGKMPTLNSILFLQSYSLSLSAGVVNTFAFFCIYIGIPVVLSEHQHCCLSLMKNRLHFIYFVQVCVCLCCGCIFSLDPFISNGLSKMLRITLFKLHKVRCNNIHAANNAVHVFQGSARALSRNKKSSVIFIMCWFDKIHFFCCCCCSITSSFR